uniref:Haptoglobin n=1 Tax=Bos indicus x Bos taurus TaxID=30522 RepID=A0A4W2IKK2_BOBOX
MSALQAVITLLLCGQLLAVETGSEATVDDSCPEPPKIENGYVEYLVRYQCKPYYTLRTCGDGVYTFNSKKQWINKNIGQKLPECEAGGY